MNRFLDIIIPEYDCKEEFIKRLLHSISRQKNVDFEEIGVIIVNDKSKNKLRKGIFRNYPRLNIEYYFKDKNEGVGMTRQYGLDKSNAEYVTFVDQDDELYGNTSLGSVINYLKYTKFDYLCSSYVEETLTFSGDIVPVTHDMNNRRETLHGVFLKRVFLINNDIRFKEGYRVHDDFYLKRILQTVSTPFYIKEVTYLWKYNENSQVRKKRKYTYLVETFDEYFRATKESNEYIVSKNREDTLNIVSSILAIYILLESNLFDYPELKEKKEKYEKELFKLIVEFNYQFELAKSDLDGMFNAQFQLMKNSNPNLVCNNNVLSFIEEMNKLSEDDKYDSIKKNRFLDIIVPYYQIDDSYIDTLLNSIIKQKNISKQEIGVIIVSDCSPTDVSDSLIKKYPLITVEYHRKDKNEGQGLARQYGLEKSNAEYVTFVDQDDMLFGPDALAIIISNLKNEKPKMVYTDYYRYNKETKALRLMTYKDLLCLHGVFFDRKMLIEGGYKFSDIRMYEDTYFMLITSQTQDAKYINYPTYIWNENSQSQSAIGNIGSKMIQKKSYEFVRANCEAIDFIFEKNKIDKYFIIENLCFLFSIIESDLFDTIDNYSSEELLVKYFKKYDNLCDFRSVDIKVINDSFDRVKNGYDASRLKVSFYDFMKKILA